MSYEASIGKWLSVLNRYHQMQLSRSLAHLKIGLGQVPILMAVVRSPGIRQDRMAEQMYLNRSSVARAVASLERNGYLVRTVDPKDRRSYHIRPTRKAVEAQPVLLRQSRLIAQEMMAGLDESEREALGGLLERMGRRVVGSAGAEQTEKYQAEESEGL